MKFFRSITLLSILSCFVFASKAQKVDSIFFHLYTDSLKKGVYNYINVDGKLSDGRWLPLSSKQIQFSSNTGSWDGNSLIIDSSYNKDSVIVTAVLRDKPEIKKTIIIYMKKNLKNVPLKTEDEILHEMNKGRRKGN